MQTILDRDNEFRGRHGVEALKINADVWLLFKNIF